MTARARSARSAPSARVLISRLSRAHPDARLALNFTTPFELLIALILAAQCTDERVNQVTGQVLFRKYPTPADYLRVPAAELENDIRSCGFFRAKARAIRRCCQALIERFGGTVPARLEDLLTLPGVGRKTANILLGNAFGQPAIGVDTHVLRLARRLGLSRHADPDRVEEDLNAIVPVRDRTRFCHLLQFHGRRVCRARNPRCAECVLADVCPVPASAAPAPPAAAGRARRGAARARR